MVPVDEESEVLLYSPGGPVAAGACGITAMKLLVVQPVCLQSDDYAEASLQFSAGPTSTISAVYMPKLHVTLEAALTRLEALRAHSRQDTTEDCHVLTSSLIPLQQATLELVVLSSQAQVLVRQQHSLLELLMQQQDTRYQHSQQSKDSEEAVHSIDQRSSDDGSWSVPVELCITVPCEPSGQVLDFFHLVLINKLVQSSSQWQETLPTQLHSVHPSMADPTSSHLPQQLVQLLAIVPLPLLPAVAYQEIQQQLLPAMIQEVQEEGAGNPLQVEHAVWKHTQQLIQDLQAVVLLLRSLTNPQKQAIASRIAAEAAAAANASEVDTGDILLHTSEEGLLSSGSSHPTAVPAAAAAQGAVAISSAAALDSVADVMLFPILLPFLAAHGLHNLLQLLLSVLPVELQHRWEQQQRLLLRAEYAAAEHTRDAVGTTEEVLKQSHDVFEHTEEDSARSAACRDADVQELQQEGPSCAASVLPHPRQSFSATTSQAQVELEPAEIEYDIDSKPGVRGRTSASGAVGSPTRSPTMPGTAAIASWYSPLMQFGFEDERRYLTWKHLSLLHLDQGGALFGFLYLVALLIRTISEPAALFHVVYVSLKVAPLVPLMLGFKLQFLRYRELWLWLVIPASLLGFFIFTSVQKIADPVTLLPQKSLSAFWKSRGELAVNAMIPFIQHMRLRPYIVYCLVDAGMMSWVFAQFYGWWEAAGRWGFASLLSIGLCWGLDLHMRRKFVAAEHRIRA